MKLKLINVLPDKVGIGTRITPYFDADYKGTYKWHYKINDGSWNSLDKIPYIVPTTCTVGDVLYFKVIFSLTNGTTFDTWEKGYRDTAVLVTYENTYQNNVPVIDIIFNKDTNGKTQTESDFSIKDATLTISHPVPELLIPNKNFPRIASKISRKLSKNPIYINFPTYTEQSGGYGYDLGFLSDTFTFTIATTDYTEYERIYNLCKINVGESSGILRVGKILESMYGDEYPSLHSYSSCLSRYKILVQSTDADFEPGTFTIRYTITVMVVFDGT